MRLEPFASSGGFRCCRWLYALSACLLAVSPLLAQSSPQRLRTMHLWVDPHHGDDALAMQFNVLATNPALCAVGQIAPNDVLNTSGAVLLHQPYPFRTITQAVAYVDSLPPTVSASDPLPYSSSATLYTWEYAIIHLLPGRYASARAPEQQSAHNQLIANGEAFPIELPNRVSIQGTSALDTVIEVSQGEGPAFLIGWSPTSCGEHTFISTVSFVGGNPDVTTSQPPAGIPPQYTAAAIAIGQHHPSELRMDDCFFFGNGVGVLIDAVVDDPMAGHEVYVLNCTFAWNVVGLWSGDALIGGSTSGISRVMLVNNLFDTTPPPLQELIAPACGQGTRPFPQRWSQVCVDMAANGIYGQGVMTAFEGIDRSDLRVETQPNTFRNFNAYEVGVARAFDTRAAFPSMLLPSTSPRSVPPSNPDGGYDIGTITGASLSSSGRRGVLYICDLFRNGYQLGTGTGLDRFATAVSCNFDLSPMDFRLAPAVANAQPVSSPPNVPGALSPLVDKGYSSFPIVMENGMTLAQHPRALDLGSDSEHWPFDDWTDFTDCEGFGNRRVLDHPVYATNDGPIDVGADELDLLVIGGWRYGTRTFTEFDDPTSSPPIRVDNRYIWAFGPPDSLAPVPVQGEFAHMSSNWWATPGPAAYNTWSPPWPAWSPTARPYYNPFVVDVTPHLLPDTHPYHAVTTASDWPTNPVWQDCAGHPLQSLHNPFLYQDPTEPLPNPAGVFPALPLSGFAFLDGVNSPWPAHQMPLSGMGALPFGFWDKVEWFAVAKFGDWCQARNPAVSQPFEAAILGDAVGNPPRNTWHGVYPHEPPSIAGNSNYVFPTGGAQRISLELFHSSMRGTLFGYDGPSNIQTFMIWRQTAN